ncbi:hypothetical protein B0H14DRAFT_2348878 [Mycena olivaceomarginata]|nr:hypothetical protein B0H14DRAFT_2348878 [Mycena olivaceomarginata]
MVATRVPLTPILILGGHTHIRDCLQLDGRSMSLESDRYIETIGWMSAEPPRAEEPSWRLQPSQWRGL